MKIMMARAVEESGCLLADSEYTCDEFAFLNANPK